MAHGAHAEARSTAELDHELKYVVPRHQQAVAATILDQLCVRDPKYPGAYIWSLYYDTPQLKGIFEKANGDYLKQKIRLRWYEPLESEQASGPVFVEAKIRVGTRRTKARSRLAVDADELARSPHTMAELVDLPNVLASLGVRLPSPLRPLLTLRYLRRRWVEPLSGVRVALDTAITPISAHPRLLAGRAGKPLATGVLEVKGARSELPQRLRPLAQAGFRRSAYSKYNACFETITGSEP